MRKVTISLLSLLLTVSFAYAGGLVTNTNQSAAWSRMLVRDASTSIDAVYFNPAGLTKLSDGFHLSFSSQTIFQKQTIISSFPYLNQKTYTGNISAPIFPDLYMAYKAGRWVFSFGFNPIGGGGTAKFDNGIPMGEVPIAALQRSFAGLGVTGYSSDMYLKGSSAYYGFQLGVSYAVSNNFSVFLGGRYVMVRNSYSGYVKDIKFKLENGSYVRADTFMKGVGAKAVAGAKGAVLASTGLQNWVGVGAGGYTFAQAVAGGAMTAAQAATFKGALAQFGFTSAQIDAFTLSQAQAAFNTTATTLTTQAKQLYGGATLMADQILDVKQSGNGFTPIVGADISFANDNLNIGIKYEFKTNITITNSTTAGEGYVIGLNPTTGAPIEMFPNGAKTNADIPSYLSVGIRYNISKVVSIQGGWHLYGDRSTGWKDVKNKVGKNYQEYGLGAEFNVTPKLLLSTGYLYSHSGVNQAYQSDLNYSLTANTIAAGGAYKISNKITLQFGAYVVNYKPETYSMTQDIGTIPVIYNNTFKKFTWAVSAGLDFSFGKKK